MARKYRYRRRYRKKGRWSANIGALNESFNYAGSDEGELTFRTLTLCQNPAQNSSTISQQYTVKNIELQYWLSGPSSTALSNISVYIMYVPQGMTLDIDYVDNHPEYIMAYKFLGNLNASSNDDRPALYIKSRLSRRLQTGDGVILYIKGTRPVSPGVGVTVNLNGIVRWWTKAN